MLVAFRRLPCNSAEPGPGNLRGEVRVGLSGQEKRCSREHEETALESRPNVAMKRNSPDFHLDYACLGAMSRSKVT